MLGQQLVSVTPLHRRLQLVFSKTIRIDDTKYPNMFTLFTLFFCFFFQVGWFVFASRAQRINIDGTRLPSRSCISGLDELLPAKGNFAHSGHWQPINHSMQNNFLYIQTDEKVHHYLLPSFRFTYHPLKLLMYSAWTLMR